jgi:hypothetical protein
MRGRSHDRVPRGRMAGGGVCASPESRKIRPEPDGNHQNEGHGGRVEEKVELVKLVSRRGSCTGGTLFSRGHDLLEEDI